MTRTLYGRSARFHAMFGAVFGVLFVGFIVLAVVGGSHVSYQPHQWALMGFVTLSAGLSAAWELRAYLLLRGGRSDPPPPASDQPAE